MIRFLLRRLAFLLVSLMGLVAITFVISHVAPADPAALAAGPDATASMIATIRHQYGLDRPLPVQFLRYVGDLARLQLGHSIATGHAVTADLAVYLPATLELVLLAMGFAIGMGITLGILAAVRREGLVDHFARIFAVGGIAVPAFWIALILQLLFSVYWRLLPIGGQLPVAIAPPRPITGMVILDALLREQPAVASTALVHALLPAFVLSLPCLASILRITRQEMVEVLQAHYVRTARAQGIAPTRVVTRLALRNAMVPILSMIGLRFGFMLGTTVLVETVFDWPGLGLYAVTSATSADFAPVMGATLAIGVLFMLATLVVDLLYAVADPRIRVS